ncbi:MAG: CBS domain-containing protein [Acidimicrobiales bacterium]|nr:CBS domain-containing protein [Acidimicrobiales bacterium]
MNVEAILRSKGSWVATITPEAGVVEAAALLARHGIGALVVCNPAEKIVGIVSERDITRALGAVGSAIANLHVADIMTREVHTCSRRDSVDKLALDMTQRRIRHLPVVGDGELVGLVSIGDVVKSRIDELQQETNALHRYITDGR